MIVGDHAVTDLGPEFTVRRILSNVEVAVLQGRAQFESMGRETPLQSAELSSGDVAVSRNARLGQPQAKVGAKVHGTRPPRGRADACNHREMPN